MNHCESCGSNWVGFHSCISSGPPMFVRPVMSRRDHFAAAALQGIIAAPNWIRPFSEESLLAAAHMAAQVSDYLIAELDKAKP